MLDHLLRLSEQARKRVYDGYYDIDRSRGRRHESLVQVIKGSGQTPVITEIKYASPSSGRIRKFESPVRIAREMLGGGACAISILTDPQGFQGGLEVLTEVAEQVDAPLIMKDIIVSSEQLRAASKCGADAVVLISELFNKGLVELDINEVIQEARDLGLETLVEAHAPAQFERIQRCKPDLYGINNRDLNTLEVSIDTTERILSKCRPVDGIVVSESGITTAADVRRLRAAGAHAFLVGTSIMESADIKQKVRELVNS